MSIDDPVIRQSYDAYVQACLYCVVTGVKFLAFAVKDEYMGMPKPSYLPYAHVVGFSKLYDKEIAHVADTVTFSDDNQEKFVLSRREKNLSMLPIVAYREHFDNYNERFDSQRLPMHKYLLAHFDPEKETLYSALSDTRAMAYFCHDAAYEDYDMRSLSYRRDSAVFNIQTLLAHVHYTTADPKEEFLQAALEHCEAIGRLVSANRQTASIFAEYLNEKSPKDVKSLVMR